MAYLRHRKTINVLRTGKNENGKTYNIKQGNYVGFKELQTLYISLNLTCTSIDAAEAVALKLTESLAAEIFADKGIGFGRPRGYEYLGAVSWMGFSTLAAVDSYTHSIYTWSERDENLNIKIFLMYKPLTDEDYENYATLAKNHHSRIFYDVNGD